MCLQHKLDYITHIVLNILHCFFLTKTNFNTNPSFTNKYSQMMNKLEYSIEHNCVILFYKKWLLKSISY